MLRRLSGLHAALCPLRIAPNANYATLAKNRKLRIFSVFVFPPELRAGFFGVRVCFGRYSTLCKLSESQFVGRAARCGSALSKAVSLRFTAGIFAGVSVSRSRLAALCEPHSASCGPYKESPDEWRRQGLSEEGRHRRGAGCPKAGRCASRRWYSKAARCRLVAQLSGCAVEALCLMPTRCRFWDLHLIDLFGQFKYNRFWRGHGGTFSRAILRGARVLPSSASYTPSPGSKSTDFKNWKILLSVELHAVFAL